MPRTATRFAIFRPKLLDLRELAIMSRVRLSRQAFACLPTSRKRAEIHLTCPPGRLVRLVFLKTCPPRKRIPQTCGRQADPGRSGSPHDCRVLCQPGFRNPDGEEGELRPHTVCDRTGVAKSVDAAR